MNSDPYDSAAWKTFGMLDADESAAFDDAMRSDPALRKYALEMDRLSAAIAACTTAPVEPEAGLLERVQDRLRHRPSRTAGIWLAVTGWAAAIALALVLVLGRDRLESATKPAAEPPDASGRQHRRHVRGRDQAPD